MGGPAQPHCHSIQRRALVEPESPLPIDHVLLIAKEGRRNQHRPVALYELAAHVIISRTAQYLRSRFDPLLQPCSYAFRAKQGRQAPPTHHDAVAALLDYRERHDLGSLWVAECDIRGFYDTLHHDVARRAVAAAVDRATAEGRDCDRRALAIFEQFLASYSFPRTVLAETVGSDPPDRDRREVPWPAKELQRFYADPASEPIGVPQGGAISGVIANLVLDPADRAVLALPAAAGAFYARYCDDMILMSPDRTACDDLMTTYYEAMEAQALLAHRAESVTYGRQFWQGKSKAPYRWGPTAAGGAPWTGFLGYQIRYDGLLRVRQESMRRELTKQVREADRLLFVLSRLERAWDQGMAAELRQPGSIMLRRLAGRLSAMAVGRVRPGLPAGPGRICWASGFRLLHGRPHVATQLRRLDRGRQQQLQRVRRALFWHGYGIAAVNGRCYQGQPYSYQGGFIASTRANQPTGQAAD